MISSSLDYLIRKPDIGGARTRLSRPSVKSRPSRPATPIGSSSNIEKTEIPTITWDDFSAEPDTNSPWAAHTYWHIRYKYKISFSKDKHNIKLDVTCQLKNNSWVKRKEDRLLAHERGHYLIGWICALEFKKRVKNAKLSKTNHSSEVQKIFQETLDEYLKWEILYDEETDHYKNISNQQKWDRAIARKLEQLRMYLEAP